VAIFLHFSQVLGAVTPSPAPVMMVFHLQSKATSERAPAGAVLVTFGIRARVHVPASRFQVHKDSAEQFLIVSSSGILSWSPVTEEKDSTAGALLVRSDEG